MRSWRKDGSGGEIYGSRRVFFVHGGKGQVDGKGVGGLKRSHTQTANHTLTPAPVSSVTGSSSASSSKQPRIQDNDTMRINERERTTSVAEIRTSRTRR